MDVQTANAIFARDTGQIIAFVTELVRPGVLEDILNPTLDRKFANTTRHEEIRGMLGLIVTKKTVQDGTFTDNGRAVVLHLVPLLLLIYTDAIIGQCPPTGAAR